MTPDEQIAAAVELAEWKGEVNGRLQAGTERMDGFGKGLTRIEEKVDNLREESATNRGKLLILGIGGSALVTLAIALAAAFGTKLIG